MKKITSILLILLAFASCKNRDFKDYIEQGFSKPTVSDVHFSKSNIGDGNKLYVPSEKEIEVEFTIKNRYSKELQGTLELQENKKALFNTLPYIKELTFTKMVIAFNFKKEGEPSNTNHFLGESVPITLKIYDKKTSHFLSSQNISANCNTAPLSIPRENIHYDQDEDEYVVRLPKNQEKHEDLKKVEFYLSDEGGNKSASPKIFSIVEETEQNVVHHLKIKGDENWQLGKPQGDRTLKAIVYDRAGLKSTEGKDVSHRIFATITLVPDHDDVDLSSIKNGLKAPKIKELVDYFQTREVWEASGYSVSFISDYFEYDSQEDKLREKVSGSIEAKNEPYKVKIQLTGGGNTLTAEYEITVVEDTVAGINTSKFSITDETEYNPPTYPKLNFPNVTFEDDGLNGKKASIEVPYTGSVTKLKVYVEALGSNGKIRENPLDVGSKTKTFDEIKLGANRGDPDGTKTLEFYAAASNGPATKKYTIEFVRGESVTVNVSVANELLQSDDCKVEMSWTYGKKEVSISKTQAGASSDPLNVAKGAGITFKITAGNGDRIKECRSGHAPITIDDPKTKSFELLASANFVLTVTFRAEASFKWVDIGGENSTGYERVCVSYHLNNETHNEEYGITPPPTPEKAIKKDEECKFWIKGLNPANHRILNWVVNSEVLTASKSDNSIILSDDKTSLTIKKPNGDYVVKVFTTELCKLDLKVCNSGGTEITDHNYTFEVKKDANNGTLLHPNTDGKYVEIDSGTQLYITAKAGTRSEYDIEKWERKLTTDTAYSPFTDSEITKRNFSITGNTVIKITLKKKTFRIKWAKEGGNALFVVKVNDATITSTSEHYVEIGSKFEINTTPEDKYLIKGWKVKDTLYDGSNNATDIVVSNEKKKLTINHVTKALEIALVLEVKKYTIRVEIEAPSGVTNHKYTIKAEKGSTALENKASLPAYKYEGVEHGTQLTIRAIKDENGSPCIVEKWESRPGGGSWTQHCAEAYVVQQNITSDTDFKIVLKHNPVKFKFIKPAASGSSFHANSKLVLANQTEFEEININDGEAMFNLKVQNLTASYKVVSWKLNGSEEKAKSKFLKNDGFWKENIDSPGVKLKAGDEIEVKVDAVQRINLKVEEGSSKYTGNYKLVIKQSESDKSNVNHLLLPIKEDNVIEITKDSGSSYPIYITEGTQLDFSMDDLPTDKEIGEWLKDDTTPLGNEFNENHDKNNLRVGKLEVNGYVYPVASPPQPISITAKIRNATSMATFSIKDYKEKNKTSDGNIKLKVSYTDGGASIVNLSGNDNEFKCRVLGGKKIKFEIEEETDHQYYFAEWEGDVSDGNKFKKEIEIDIPNKTFTVSALCTKTVIVHVHSLLQKDRGHGNFHNGWFGDLNSQTFGRITVGETTGGNFNGGSAGANGSGEEARYLSKISIEETENTNLNNLSIKYYYSGIRPLGQGKVYWRYDFNNLGGGKEPRYNTETNHDILDEHKDNAIVKFKKLPSKCVVLHIWLYKVQKRN